MSENNYNDDWWIWALLFGAAVYFGYGYFYGDDETVDDGLPSAAEVAAIPDPRPTSPIYITTLESGAVWMLDSNSVIGPRTKRLGWIIADLSADSTTSSRERKMLYIADCETTAYTTPEIVDYMPNGDPVTLSPTGENYAVPGSNGASVIRALCDESFDTPAR